MSKIIQRMTAETSIPASWVVWLLDEYVPDVKPQETNKVAGGKAGVGL